LVTLMSDMVISTAQLIAEVFPGSQVSRTDYLRWLYDESPFGGVIETNLDDEQGRVGHYALVPVALSLDGSARAGALSLNTAVHERARGGGLFVRLASETFEKARRDGIDTILGVANANSTPGFVRRLGFSLVCELPATVMIPTPHRDRSRFLSVWAAPGAHELLEDATDLLGAPGHGLARSWNPETLAWRLRAPGARYALHRADDVFAVSTVVRSNGLRVAVILKVFARQPLGTRMVRALVWSAARWHRAPLVLHVGLNDRFKPRGIALPQRLRPSPLNLIHRELTPGAIRPPVVRFEFLDFDPY
jgi:GNAT superfamily N-acetyltransferase